MLRRFLPALFWTALLFAFVMATLPKPPSLPGSPSDKVQHILAFTVLAALAAAAFPRARLVPIGAGLCLFGALIELVQAIPALHRDAELADWLADIAAVGVVLLLAWRLRRGLRR